MGSHLKSHKKKETNLSIENNNSKNKSNDSKIENNSENDNDNKNDIEKDRKIENNRKNDNDNKNDIEKDRKIENNSENDNDNKNDIEKEKTEKSNYDNKDKNNDTKDNDCIDDEIKRKLEEQDRKAELIASLIKKDTIPVRDPVEEYENFCKDLIFIEDNKVTIKVNQKFAAEFCRNYTISPEFWSDFPKVESKDESIELIDTRTFYPYSLGTCGGDDHRIFVFKANKKGKFKIKFDTHTVKVKVTV